MNIHELRRGNYFLWKDGFGHDVWIVVTTISKAMGVWFVSDVPEYNCLPIPITEKTLLKCGFEQENTIWKNGWLELWYSSYAESYQVRLIKVGSDIEKSINIKSVHQLQNLYFALTGEELKIDLLK